MRQDVYRVVRAVFDKTMSSKVPTASLTPEDLRLLQKIEQEYRRNGLALPEAQQVELKQLKKRLSEVCIDFSKAVNEDQT